MMCSDPVTLTPVFINKWPTKSLRWCQLVSEHYTGFAHVLPTSLSLEKHGLCLYYVHSDSEERRKRWWEVYWQQVRLIRLWDGQYYQTTGSSNNRHMSSGYWSSYCTVQSTRLPPNITRTDPHIWLSILVTWWYTAHWNHQLSTWQPDMYQKQQKTGWRGRGKLVLYTAFLLHWHTACVWKPMNCCCHRNRMTRFPFRC